MKKLFSNFCYLNNYENISQASRCTAKKNNKKKIPGKDFCQPYLAIRIQRDALNSASYRKLENLCNDAIYISDVLKLAENTALQSA